MSRKAVVAGQFYPADPQALKSAIEAATPAVEGGPSRALGALCPHAGYPFSGGVAGALFARIRVPDTVLLLTPSHSFLQPAFALWTDGAWETPLGSVRLHEALTEALSRNRHITPADHAHRPEHSGEVVLPFLQYHNPGVRIAVICVTGSAGFPALREVGAFVADVLNELEQPDALVLASSDMSHERGGHALDVVRRNDALAIAEMEKLDAEGLLSVCRLESVTMCGVLPAAVMMESVAARGGTAGTLVKRATSADSPLGGGDYVVGYAGMRFD